VRFCDSLFKDVREIANNVEMQQKYAGVPYSWGNAGEGVRLVLGSDVTQKPANVVGVATPTKTEWLVPASPGAFAPECADPSNSATSQCRLIGQRDTEYFGSGPSQPKSYPLGYPADFWKPAGAAVWKDGLRGMQPLTGAQGDPASLLSIMETGNEPFGAVPFKGIRDRVWVRFYLLLFSEC